MSNEQIIFEKLSKITVNCQQASIKLVELYKCVVPNTTYNYYELLRSIYVMADKGQKKLPFGFYGLLTI